MAADKKQSGKTVTGTKQMGTGIGVSAAVVIAWALETYGGVELPAEVVAAVSGIIGAIGGWVSDK